ncbi:TIM barrel protein [Nanoarchaeota archaeon]
MQFSTGPYYSPMDRESHAPDSGPPKLEKPIVPISELGVTVLEKDPLTGGNIIQNVDAAIRQGASTIQLVFNQSHQSPMGGRPKAYGEDVRRDLRELSRANSLNIEGVEMPTSSMTNMSGFDMQHRAVSEQKRQTDLQEVKDAIRFVGDVARGGGVDIWSQEFARDIYDARWNKDGKHAGKFEAFEQEERFATAYVVDKRTGRIHEIPKGQPIFEPVYKRAEKEYMGADVDGKDAKIHAGDWVTDDGKYIDPNDPQHLIRRVPKWNDKKKEFEVAPLDWKEIVKRTHDHNARYGEELLPEEYAIRTQLDNQWIQRKGQSLYYSTRYNDDLSRLKALRESIKHYEKLEESVPEDELWKVMDDDPVVRYSKYVNLPKMKPSDIIKREIDDVEHHLKHVHEASSAADAQAMEIEYQKKEMVALKRYALEKSEESYAEAGITALDETRQNKHCKKDIFVGPEIGWPTAYGGHPEEFIELIEKSRDRMAERLKNERGYSKDEAKDLAKTHIKGCFDTSHMGMWLQHFKKDHPQEAEEHRRKRFNNWFMDMVKEMEKKEVIGTVQAVDSMSAAHGHLPAGQGIFPVVEAVDYLKSKGFTGAVVSEGHEEEQFGRGRILLETWRAFGADIGGSYFAPEQRQTWSNVSEQYFGHCNPPPYVIGQYRPTDDWVFWSGVPLE